MNYIQLYRFLVALVLPKVLGSVSADEEDGYRFFVKLETKGKLLACAGTILTPCVVLTSAHCVEGGKPEDITVTSASMVRYETAAVTVHPHYDSTTLRHDLALVQTKKNFQKPWTGLHVSSRKPKACNFFQMITVGDHIIGNEITANPIKKNVRLLSNTECAKIIEKSRGTFQGEEKMCGRTIDKGEEEVSGCFVNPGGPLMCHHSLKDPSGSAQMKGSQNVKYWKRNETLADPIDLLESLKKMKRRAEPEEKIFLVGVVSWGKGCSEVPSVYVRTDLYYGWLTETAKRMTEKYASNPPDFRFLTELKSKAGKVSFSDISKFMVFLCSYYISPLVL